MAAPAAGADDSDISRRTWSAHYIVINSPGTRHVRYGETCVRRRLICALIAIGVFAGCGSDHNAVAPSAASAGQVFGTPGVGVSSATDFARCLGGVGDSRCFAGAALGVTAPVRVAAATAPFSLRATAAGSVVTLTWTAPDSGEAVTAYLIEAGSASGLANLASFSTGNTATTFTAPGVGAGTYYVRVRAITASGVGSASNEAILVVGAGSCAVPSAPASLTIVTNSGGTVGLSWTAPSGTPTTYIIEAG